MRSLEKISLLLPEEFQVIGAVVNGRALLEAATLSRPDIIVTDISMPVLNGLEAGRQLIQKGARVKIVFLTVHRDPELLQAALETGALGYILKTGLSSDLIPAVRHALQGRKFVSDPVIDP